MSEDNKGGIMVISALAVVFLIILLLVSRSDISDSEKVTERVKLRYQFELDSLKIARGTVSTH